MTETRDTANHSEASREHRIRELAVLDWARMPANQVRERMADVSWQTLCAYRDDDLYKEVMAELRAEWNQEMLRLPSYKDLKKKVEQAMALGVDAVIDILAGEAANKDKIAAARLAAQMDGRFLRSSDDDPNRVPKDAESVGNRLLEALERKQPTVQ